MIKIYRNCTYNWNGLGIEDVRDIITPVVRRYIKSFRYYPSIDEDDLFLIVLLKIEESRNSADIMRERNPCGYLYTLAKNALINYLEELKAKKRRHEKGDRYLEELNNSENSNGEKSSKTWEDKVSTQSRINRYSQDPFNPLAVQEYKEIKDEVLRSLESLKESVRVVFEDYFFAGYSFSEACRRHGCVRSTMYERLRRIFPKEKSEK
jgi:RNA polymerase sigma factor (sigma-70 family)